MYVPFPAIIQFFSIFLNVLPRGVVCVPQDGNNWAKTRQLCFHFCALVPCTIRHVTLQVKAGDAAGTSLEAESMLVFPQCDRRLICPLTNPLMQVNI